MSPRCCGTFYIHEFKLHHNFIESLLKGWFVRRGEVNRCYVLVGGWLVYTSIDSRGGNNVSQIGSIAHEGEGAIQRIAKGGSIKPPAFERCMGVAVSVNCRHIELQGCRDWRTKAGCGSQDGYALDDGYHGWNWLDCLCR